jgi:hypothetical protein
MTGSPDPPTQTPEVGAPFSRPGTSYILREVKEQRRLRAFPQTNASSGRTCAFDGREAVAKGELP